MPPSRNILEALFDVRPTTKSGVLDFEKISKVRGIINLKPEIAAKIENLPAQAATVLSPIPKTKYDFVTEFERAISEPIDPTLELAKYGGEIYVLKPKGSKSRNIEKFWKKETNGKNEIQIAGANAVSAFSSPAERELNVWLEMSRSGKNIGAFRENPARIRPSAQKKKTGALTGTKLISILVVAGILGLTAFGFRGGMNLKNNIVKNGGDAVSSLQKAKENFASFNFLSAADNFALAYDDFGKASDNLNSLGANFLSNFSDIPGLDKVKSANDLVKAGQNISKAGENLALAFNTLSRTNFLSKISLSKTVDEFKNVLIYADNNITEAGNMVADIEPTNLPEDKQQLFIDFKQKIPEFQRYIGSAINYSDFLSGVIGDNSSKRYLILLQNNSELRATGGFPGSYALISFENGFLKDVKVDDVYNIDGQLKENIIPPIPLRHITPNWGMRDANWFADFPTSAEKVEEFYKKDGGGDVDGVFTLTPAVIGKILDIIGGLDMPEYGVKLDSKNFVSEIQKEVEYGANRAQPKTIVKDMQPKLFAKLTQQDGSKWLEIFKILTQAVEEKHILAFFNDPKLEKVAVENSIAGEIKKTDSDYLQVVFSNIKGSKTDAVIDNLFNLATVLSENSISQKLTITRTHNGGDSKYGFYNKVNPTYVRVFVPEGSILKKINGNSITDFRALIGYSDFNFKIDPDLTKIESSMAHPSEDIDIFEESGKTVFGFWLVLNPKQTKSVTVEYESGARSEPNGYSLLWQKQSGTNSDPINIKITPPKNKKISGNQSGVGDNSDLLVDREIKINFQ